MAATDWLDALNQHLGAFDPGLNLNDRGAMGDLSSLNSALGLGASPMTLNDTSAIGNPFVGLASLGFYQTPPPPPLPAGTTPATTSAPGGAWQSEYAQAQRKVQQIAGSVTAPSGPTAPTDVRGSAPWRPLIDQAAAEIAQQYGLNPQQLADAAQAVLEIESHGAQNAVGKPTQWGQAQGLMQVMPFHFQPGENPFDPATNIRHGVAILAHNVQQTGSWEAGAAAYFGAYDWQTHQITEAQDPNGQTGSGYVQQWRNAYGSVQQWRQQAPSVPTVPPGQ